MILERQRLRLSAMGFVVAMALAPFSGCAASSLQEFDDTRGPAERPTASMVGPDSQVPSTSFVEPVPASSGALAAVEEAGSVAITILDGQASATPSSMAVPFGYELVVIVTADRAGVLEVIGSPGERLRYRAGTTRQALVLSTPGTTALIDGLTGTVLARVDVVAR